MGEEKNPFEQNNLEEENLAEENEENEENQEESEESAEEIENQEKQDDFQEKYNDLNNKYIRLAADFDNFRKRCAQEKEEFAKYAAAETLKQLTAVLDTFDRAHEHLKDIEDCKTVKDSYEVAHKQLLDALEKIGLKEIEALGQEFNPNEHEAITQVPTDEYEPDYVALVAQKGYKLKDKVLRPALVGVAVKKDE